MAVPTRAEWTYPPVTVQGTNGMFNAAVAVWDAATVRVEWADANTGVVENSVEVEASQGVTPISIDAAVVRATAGTKVVSARGVNSSGVGEAATARVVYYDPPALAITSPAASVDGYPLVVTWTAEDPTGIATQAVVVRDSSGSEVWANRQLGADVRALSLGVGDIALADGEAYVVAVSAINGAGIAGDATKGFVVSWVAPAAPTISVANDAGSLSATVTVGLGTDASAPATESLALVRVDALGGRWVMASGLTSGTTVTDPLPPLGVGYSYEAIATAASGAAAKSVAGNSLGGCGWAINYGPRAETCYLLGRDPDDRGGHEHGGEAYHFADGGEGGGLPVFYPTPERDSHGTLELTAEDMGQLNDLMRTAKADPMAWLRDPWGQRWRAHVTPSWKRGRRSKRATLDWSEDRWREAW